MLRAGIIGLGRIAVEFPDNHAKAYISHPHIYLASVCDTNEVKIAECLNKWVPQPPHDYTTFTDYIQMVKVEHLDIVSVCTPPETHFKIVCDIAPYVKAIYCEKPMALKEVECWDMFQTCMKHKVILQINHQRRWVIPTFYYSRGIMNTGTHMFDLLHKMYREVDIQEAHKVGDFNGDPLISGVVRGFPDQMINIVALTTEEPVFKFNVAECPGSPIADGVQDIVDALGKKRLVTKSDGRMGAVAVKLVNEFIDKAEES